MFSSIAPRTQSVKADRCRPLFVDVLGGLGEARDVPPAEIELPTLIAGIRERSGLSAHDVAQLVGVQRRQLYNLVAGAKASARREQRIRAIAKVIDELYTRLGHRQQVRSALLTPLDADLRTFLDVAQQNLPRAHKKLVAVLDREQRPAYIQRPGSDPGRSSVAEVIKETRDIVPNTER